MQTGDLNVLGDLCAGGYQMIYNQETAGSTTSINITPIVGQTDKEYRLIVSGMNPLAAAQTYLVRPNNNSDATAYGQQNMTGTAAVAAAARTTGSGIWLSDAAITSANYMFADMALKSRSGTVRTALVKSANNINQTSVGSINFAGWSWIDTSASVTSLMLGGVLGSSNVMLFARKPSGSDSDATGIPTGDLDVQGDFTADVMQKVYETTLTASASSVTISGLNGNTDVLYRLSTEFKNDSGLTAYYGTRTNNDSGTNYGIQYFGALNTTLDTLSSAVYTELYTGYATTGTQSLGELTLYAKSGHVRTAIIEHTQSVSGTTVTYVYLMGNSWNNTTDNITSLVIFSSVAGGIGIGTYICLERLVKSI